MLDKSRHINLLVVHCSATPQGMDIGRKEIDAMHRARGWNGIGYHFVIRLDGTVEQGRPVAKIGAHAEGYNAHSIGICLVGGLDHARKPANTFTNEQFAALEKLLRQLLGAYPIGRTCGHRDLSPDLNHDGKITPNEWMKSCPCFDVAEWLKSRGLTGRAL